MSLKQRTIGLIGGYSPLLQWWRAKRPLWAWRLHSVFGKPTTKYVEENGLTVKRGDFEGLQFPPESVGRTNYLAAKLAGAYEAPVVSFLAAHAVSHKTFVDLGSGDGFFLSGLGRINSALRLIGYEVNSYERDLAAKIASENGVNAEFRTLADEGEVSNLPEEGLLLLCDLEGLEEDLIDPAVAPNLSGATMVVEAHSQFRPSVVSVLTERFERTHEVTHIRKSRTDPAPFEELQLWPPDQARYVLNDGHEPSEGWLTFVPRRAEEG